MWGFSSPKKESSSLPKETVIRCGLLGVGSVGIELLKILLKKQNVLRERYNVKFLFVVMADSSGTLVNHHGLEIDRILALKTGKGFVPEEMEGFDTTVKHPLSMYKISVSKDSKAEKNDKLLSQIWFYPSGTTITPSEVFKQENILPSETFKNNFILFDATPVNMKNGEPGLSAVKNAMERGANIVLANKGPLVLAFHELQEISQRKKVNLLYSATVCGGLPVLNVGKHDLPVAEFSSIRGVFNSTTNFILAEMERGRLFKDALKEAQDRGIAETDPSLDVEGQDTANKLFILCSTVLQDVPLKFSDIHVEGITGVSEEMIKEAQSEGKIYKLVASATREPNGSEEESKWIFTVKPERLERSDFLAQCSGWEMGVEFHSDLFGQIYQKVNEREPIPTAAAMLRDAIAIDIQARDLRRKEKTQK